MADIESAAGGDQPMDSAEGQDAELCSNCNEAYCWIYGEDCIPASLSCGHTICFKCAGSQWQSPGSEDLMVYCVPCSVHVAITGYKSLPSSRTEQSLGTVQNTPTSSSRAEKCEAGMDSHGASEGEPVQNTPTQLQSSTVVIQQHSSSGKQNSSVGYTMDRVTSALSSPLVLDKIQSQDDAWRILQHDEGFIRDWIVANVPDHVIFKMVGAGNPDSSLDSGGFIAGNSSTVIVSSPPKAVDMVVTTPVTTTAGSTSFPGVSTSQGENTSRVSFEQQFLQYLVSKAAPQDKLTSVVDVSKEHGLQGPLTTVDSAAQTSLDPIMEESGGMEPSSALPRNKAVAMEIMMQGLKHVQPGRVGNKGDCSVAHVGKNSSQLPNGLMGVFTEGEASQQAADFQSHPVQTASSQNVSAEAGQYDSDPSVLQAQPAAYSSYLPGASIAYQQNYNSHMFGTPGKNTAQFPSFPAQRNMESGAFTGPHGPYSTYPYPYSQHSHYPWHKQYGQPYARMPQPGPFVRLPHYAPHRGGRFGRERSLAFPPPPFRMSSEPSWSSKACTMTLNPPPQTTLSALPQIRFVQVVRPKPDHLGMSEGPRMEEDAAALSGRLAEEIVEKEMPAVEAHEETEGEVALMKTRDMPHGTQVEDIYVVPQVWLTGGRDSTTVESSQDDCPYPADSPLTSPSNPSLSVSESAVGEGAACLPASALSPGKTRFDDNYDTEQPNSAAIPGFAGSKLSLMSREQAPETSGMLRASEATTNTLSESAQEKNATNDGSVYTGFKPVAVVTTVSAGKTRMAAEPRAEMTAPEISNLPPPPFIHSNTMTPAPIASNGGTFDQRQATETPVRDTAMMTDDVLGEGSIGQVPSAPVKKMDRNLEQKYNTQALPLRQNIIEYSHQKVENSAQTPASSAGPCNKTIQDAIASEIAMRAELDAQTSASGNEVQILEGKSTLRSAIMFSKQDAPGVPQSRKRLRRNLSSEFCDSDMGIGGGCYGNQQAETRASGRSRRWNPSKYSQYGSSFCSPQEAWFPHNYPYNYRPRPYYYHQTLANAQNASLNYRHPRRYPEVFSLPNSEKLGQFGMPVDEVVAPRQPGAMYSLLHRPAAYTPACPPFTARSQHSAPLSSQTFPSTSLSQPYSDAMSHPSSGRGDYSNTSSVSARPKQQSSTCTTTGLKTGLGCGSDCDPPVGRGVPRQSQVWPADRGQSGGTGDGAYSSVRDWRSGPVCHRVPAQDLNTFHWIQKEVRELNKEMDSSMLTRLEGCLASLLEKNASHHHHHCHPPAPASSTSTTTTPLIPGSSSSSSQVQRDVRDRDHLWRCILTLGKVVVQYGWWVRPHHHWDGSSERWAEMAMLASSVFTHSLQRLTEVITFYLDHVGTAGDGGLSQDGFLPNRMAAHLLPSHDDGPRSVDHATFLNRGYSAEGQRQIGRAQSEYVSMLPKGQSRVLRTAVGLSGPCSTAGESSKPHAASASVEQQYYSSSSSLENQMHTVMVDSPESYIPNSSAFSQYEEGGSPALPKTEIYTGVVSRSEAAFAVEDHAILTRERETTPSVMYHYRVSDVTKQTPHSEHGRSAYYDGDVGASLQGRASVWTPERADNPRISGQFMEARCSEAAEVEPPALLEDTSCALDSAQAETPAMDTASSLALDQTEMEVYYTVEGAMMNEITSDSHILTTLQGPGDGEESVYAENIVYAVSQLADANSCGELCAEDTVSYILSTEVGETAPQQPLPQEDVPLKTEPSDPTRDASPLLLILPAGDQTTPANTEVVPPGGHSLHQDSSDDKTIAEETTDSSEEANVKEAEPVFQSDQPDVNLYMVTVVPEEQADSGSEVIMCSDQEFISDAAIMLSETVEVETDTSVAVNTVKEAPTFPQVEDGSAEQKENIDSTSCSGKRKHARTTHLKNKRSKQDVWCEKQPAKGTSSANGGKWNLRSSRGSV